MIDHIDYSAALIIKVNSNNVRKTLSKTKEFGFTLVKDMFSSGFGHALNIGPTYLFLERNHDILWAMNISDEDKHTPILSGDDPQLEEKLTLASLRIHV